MKQSESLLNEMSAVHTAREIEQQPDLWTTIWKMAESGLSESRAFLFPLLKENPDLQIVLTGAGTSDFIGKSVEHSFFLRYDRQTRAVSTTTLVTHFGHYVNPARPLLLISFARSGNSPESVAVTEQADEFCDQVWHLVITCNSEGHLAKKAERMKRRHVVLLPPEANDKSLAMTSSFSGMVLAALLFSDLERTSFDQAVIEQTRNTGEHLIQKSSKTLESLAALPFKRTVFLGSGPLLGIAREAHLKLQELTDGQIVCKFDSFLGFRHGPKAVVDNETLVVYHFSHDPHSFQYELDLARQIEEEGTALETLSIFPSEGLQKEASLTGGSLITFRNAPVHCGDALIPLSILPAQLLAFYKSIELGLSPDNPSRNGAISRVVQGVTIYPYP